MRKLLAAAALVATGLGLMAAFMFSNLDSSREDKADTPTNTSTLMEGTYRVDIGPLAAPDGRAMPATSRTQTWLTRSDCQSNRCVAVAVVLDPRQPKAPAQETLVFDLIDDQWLSITEKPGKCEQPGGAVDAQSWSITSLTREPNGTFSGEYTWATAPELCATRQSVTLTPTGAESKNATPDPAAQPARVLAPAAALHGTYTYTQSYAVTGEVFPSQTYAGATYCLRTGDRCLTIMSTPDTNNVLVMAFADRRWTASFPDSDTRCSDGVGKARQTSTDDFPLPQGPQDPITVLAGKSRQVYTGDCPGKAELDVKLVRVGNTTS